jgi:hypothetical protein
LSTTGNAPQGLLRVGIYLSTTFRNLFFEYVCKDIKQQP